MSQSLIFNRSQETVLVLPFHDESDTSFRFSAHFNELPIGNQETMNWNDTRSALQTNYSSPYLHTGINILSTAHSLTLRIPRILEPHWIPRGVGGGGGRAEPLLSHNSPDLGT